MFLTRNKDFRYSGEAESQSPINRVNVSYGYHRSDGDAVEKVTIPYKSGQCFLQRDVLFSPFQYRMSQSPINRVNVSYVCAEDGGIDETGSHNPL